MWHKLACQNAHLNALPRIMRAHFCRIRFPSQLLTGLQLLWFLRLLLPLPGA